MIFSLKSATEINKIDELFKSKIAVIRDDISKSRLLDQGFPAENMVEVTAKEQLFSMLKKKHIDGFCHGELTTYYALKKSKILTKEDLSVIHVNQRGPLYFGFSLSVDKNFVDRFQDTMSEVLKDKKLMKLIHARYF